MDWLDTQILDAIYDAAVGADLVDRDTRTVLLQSVGDDVRLALPDHPRPDLQFRSDLRLLNLQPAGQPAPLRAWLAEAANLAEGRPAATVFTDALARPDAGGAHPDRPSAPTPDPLPSGPADAGVGSPWRLPAAIGGGLAAVGLIAALATGGDPPVVDAGPVDAGPISDAGRTALRPLAIKLADASRGRPALYRVSPGAVAIEDVGGPRTVRLAAEMAWSQVPVTAAQVKAITGGLPPGRAADDSPISGLAARDVRAYCDGLSRAEGLRPFYADGGAGYRLPPEDAWLFTCVGGQGGAPAPGAWGLRGFGSAEAVAAGPGRDATIARRGGFGGIGIGACTAGRRPLDGSADGLPPFRVVRPLAGEGERAPLGPLPR